MCVQCRYEECWHTRQPIGPQISRHSLIVHVLRSSPLAMKAAECRLLETQVTNRTCLAGFSCCSLECDLVAGACSPSLEIQGGRFQAKFSLDGAEKGTFSSCQGGQGTRLAYAQCMVACIHLVQCYASCVAFRHGFEVEAQCDNFQCSHQHFTGAKVLSWNTPSVRHRNVLHVVSPLKVL